MKKTRMIRREGLFYHPSFVKREDKEAILAWLKTIHPLWEMRYSPHNPPPEGDVQRSLKRPVYWLGNWQFACLNYYHPPHGIHHRCVKAEDYPPVLKKILVVVQDIAKGHFKKSDIPKNWKLNTCLINFYGTCIDEEGKKVDTARVGEHKDFEPGPVASISFGERAFFQFVQGKKDLKNNVVFDQWLEDSSLQIFGGELYKDKLFHRVQRVENKLKAPFPLGIERFETRRINFTFRYVPSEHISPFKDLPAPAREDVTEYVSILARHSAHFKKSLEEA